MARYSQSDSDYECDRKTSGVDDDVKSDSDDKCKPRSRTTKRKKRTSVEDFVLDEDDYDLLEEANAIGFRRPRSDGSNRVFKRLKKVGSRGNEAEGQPGEWRSAEEQLMLELFGDCAGSAPEDVVEEKADQPIEDEEVWDDDDMADFIVDVDEDKDGQRCSNRRFKKLESRKINRSLGQKRHAIQNVQEHKGRLEEQFEPSILADRYMMEKDVKIQETDVPERMQYLEAIVGPFPKPGDDKSVEADWIYENVFSSMFGPVKPQLQHIARLDKQAIVQQIMAVLKLMHEQRLEVPFIALYRKEYCPDLVRHSVEPQSDGRNDKQGDANVKLQRFEALWAVQHWDRKWLLLKRRKMRLRALYERCLQCQALSGEREQELQAKLLLALDETHSELGVDDVEAKYHLHFPADEVQINQGQFKRPKRRSRYSVCRQAGLGSVSKCFGLTAEQFGENLKDKRHKQQDFLLFPAQVAAEFPVSADSEFSDPESVLKGARHMAAIEIFCEPACREYVRSVYNHECVVSTKPTVEGNSVIVPFHKYEPIKWLLNKPVTAFDDDQWLLIQKAEEQQLLIVTISLPQEVMKNVVMKDFGSCYISDGASKTSKAWNEQRWQILKEAFTSQFVPFMEKEIRMVLCARAKYALAMICGSELWKMVAVAPYSNAKMKTEMEDVAAEGESVMACCWGPGNPPTTFVMLDMSGEVIDKIETAHIRARSQTTSIEQTKKKATNYKEVVDLVKDHKPSVLVFGAAKLCCRNLKEEVLSEIKGRERIDEEFEGIDYVIEDETLPIVYETSRISCDQLPGQPGIVRRAVALGRYLQNPLAMVASLFGPRKDILSLRLHPLQECLTNDELYEALEEVMVTITNQVGVDINMALFHEWLFAPVQFVCGLGPRKAAYIQRCLRGQHVNSRNELMSATNLLRRCVFTNAAGFFRIQGIGLVASTSEVVDVFGGTRIHPESYDFARKVVDYAYHEEYGTEEDDEEELTMEMAVARVKQNRSLLQKLDIQKFLSSIQNKVDGVCRRQQQTVQLILSELLHEYCELRAPYTMPSDEIIFDLLARDIEGTLAVGKLIDVTVRKVQQFQVFCTLECGISAILKTHQLSDGKCDDPSERVHVGKVITCRIKAINKAKFHIELTSKGSKLRHEQKHSSSRNVDPYYHENPTLLSSQQDKAEVKKDDCNKNFFIERKVVHPLFANISEAAAIEVLKDKEVGALIIRPSTRGSSHLTMTSKFFDEMFSHIDIFEVGKEITDLASFLGLGKVLKVDDQVFEDLDEVIAKYANPLVSRWREMYGHRKFRRGTMAEINSTLQSDKSRSPRKICFCFSVASDSPGGFMLCYLRSVNVRREYISTSPNGFLFRKRNFDTVDKLIAYFGEHCHEQKPNPHEGRPLACTRLNKGRPPGRASRADWIGGRRAMPGILGRCFRQLDTSGERKGN